MSTTKKKSVKQKAPRNELGRTSTEQAALDRLTHLMEQIASGEMHASAAGYSARPFNVGTKSPFSGRNVGMAVAASLGAGDPRFVSFAEAKARGWDTKGAKGIPFLRPNIKKVETPEGEEERQFFTSYYLFNLADIQHDLGDMPADSSCLEAAEAATLLFEAAQSLGAQVQHLADDAHMQPKRGIISMPAPNSFDSWDMYASTICHEAIHFIGRESKTVKEYQTYRGFEECVAEIGAILTLSQIGIEFQAKNAAYIASWIDHAKTTHKEPLLEAMTEASKRSSILVDAYDKLIQSARKHAA